MRLTALFALLTTATAFVVPSCRRNVALHSTPAAVDSETQIQSSSASVAEPLDKVKVANEPTPAHAETPPTPQSFTPAESENTKFQCDNTVQFWIDFNRDGQMEAPDYIRNVVEVSDRFLNKGGEAMSYWLRHNVRTGYFLTNAVLGTVASQLHERLRSKDVPDDSFATRLGKSNVVSRLLAEGALSYEQDYTNIANGKYKLPFDMYTRNRQNSPFYFGQQTTRFISEAVGTLSRSNRGSEEDKRIWLTDDKSTMYPDYYKTAFHYQTDGWMSNDSANVYETSTETLFLGCQDAMQRTALIPLVEFSKGVGSKLGRPMKVLEVACGTGRFMTFTRDNLPLDTECTAVDLSPFYLDKARENDKNWRSIRKGIEKSNGKVDAEIKIKPLTIVQAKGEDLPFGDEEFDVVICMYLYHELPREIRALVSAEMARVTKKGGIVILSDSFQKGDRPVMDKAMGKFEEMNEPHFKDYIEDYLPEHFEKVGMECLSKTVCSRTKTLAFAKPL
jgi:ubiquinone/menaquinone biosynthesis C-methylase UbiE